MAYSGSWKYLDTKYVSLLKLFQYFVIDPTYSTSKLKITGLLNNT